MDNFGESLFAVRRKKGLDQAGLADLIGVSRATISDYERGRSQPNIETLRKISALLNVSLDELLGTAHLIDKVGDQKNEVKSTPYSTPNRTPNRLNEPLVDYNRVPKIVTVDRVGNDNTVMVPARARAGYLNGHEDPAFIETLPTYRLPGMENGLFRMFEVAGHSMVPTFHESDIVICRFVDNLAEIRDDRVHVVLCHDGLVVKRALNRTQKDGKIILNSDNQRHPGEYPPLVMNPEDILEVWYIVAFISRQMRKPGEIYSRLIDLEGRLTLIEDDRKKQLSK